MKTSTLVLLVLGVLIALAGLTFTLQGLGYVGPSNGLMFDSPTWVTQGELTFVVGLILVIAGVAVNRRATPKA